MVLLSSFASAIDTTNESLLFYYKMDESSGNLVDSKDNSRSNYELEKYPTGTVTYEQGKVVNWSESSINMASSCFNQTNADIDSWFNHNFDGGFAYGYSGKSGDVSANTRPFTFTHYDGADYDGIWSQFQESTVRCHGGIAGASINPNTNFTLGCIWNKSNGIMYTYLKTGSDGSPTYVRLDAVTWNQPTNAQIRIGSGIDSNNNPDFEVTNMNISDVWMMNQSISGEDLFDVMSRGIQGEAPPTTQTDTPTVVWPSPHTNAHNNTNVTINVTHATTQNDVRYYLYFGESTPLGEGDFYLFNVTRNASEWKSFYTNISDGTYYWKWSVENITSGIRSDNTTERTFIIDTVSPTISLGLNGHNNFSADNSTIISNYLNNLSIDVSFYDGTDLYQTLINISNSSGQTIYTILNTSITGNTVNYSRDITLSNLTIGTYTVQLEATDSHTALSINDYDVKWGLDYYRYTTEEGNVIKITSDTLPLTKETTKLTDRYDFEFNYLFQKDTYKFIVESYNKIDYIQDSGYKAHFVIMGSKGGNWIDFNHPGLSSKDYIVSKIDDYTYEVEITANEIKNFKFSSLGGLNKVTEHYKLRLGSVLDVTVSDSITGDFLNATVTIGTQNISMVTYNQSNITAARLINITKDITSLTINASGYSITSEGISLTDIYHNLTFGITALNKSRIWFFDEESGDSMAGITVSVDVFSDNLSNNYTTETGDVFITNAVGVVNTIRFDAEGYHERFYFANLSTNVTNITLYMVNESNADVITATVYNQDNELLEGVYISALRYFVDSNSHKLVEMGETNFEGDTHLHLVQNEEYYKFILYYPFGTIKQTTDRTYIRDTSLLFQISLIDPVVADFHRTRDIYSRMKFFNDTSEFQWTYSDSNSVITRACLHINKIDSYGMNHSINASCLTTTSGAITRGAARENGTTFCARGIVTMSGEEWFIDGLCHTYPSSDPFTEKHMVLLIDLIMTIAFAFAFKYSVELGVIAIPLPTLFCSIMFAYPVGIPVALGLEIAAIVLAVVLNKVID